VLLVARVINRITLLLAAFALAAVSVACAASPTPDTPPPGAVPTDPAGGTRLAPGLYDMPGGTVQAIGTLEHRDLEGGFWAVIDGTGAGGEQGTVVAVIANADEFVDETRQLEGLAVVVEGTRLDGASIRIAGPEIEATRIMAATDTSDPAE